MTWKVTGHFDEQRLVALDFCEVLSLPCWIEQAAEEARMPDVLAGIS